MAPVAVSMLGRRRIVAIIATAVILILGACSTGAPSLDEPEVTAPAPSVTAAG
jgi:hypothetical protein